MMNRQDKSKIQLLEAVQLERIRVSAMSCVVAALLLLLLAAASQIPAYMAETDYPRLIGIFLFALLVLIGLIDNVRTHHCLWRLQNEIGKSK